MTRYHRQRAKEASERGRRMARARWARDRHRRERLAALSPEVMPHRILRRIVVIDLERSVREVVIWSFDSVKEAARKVRRVLTAAPEDQQALRGNGSS